jgi:hypothetical protein
MGSRKTVSVEKSPYTSLTGIDTPQASTPFLAAQQIQASQRRHYMSIDAFMRIK